MLHIALKREKCNERVNIFFCNCIVDCRSWESRSKLAISNALSFKVDCLRFSAIICWTSVNVCDNMKRQQKKPPENKWKLKSANKYRSIACRIWVTSTSKHATQIFFPPFGAAANNENEKCDKEEKLSIRNKVETLLNKLETLWWKSKRMMKYYNIRNCLICIIIYSIDSTQTQHCTLCDTRVEGSMSRCDLTSEII